jgi:ABC-type sugar transport system permease subunit
MQIAQSGRSRVLGLIVMIVGAVFVVAGVVTYVVVSSTLADQKITVADDAGAFAGSQVNQPWEAYAQATVIGKHADEIAGGKTYAELAQDDPERSTVMDASFLQASLFTSVVAFGVAVMAAVLGAVLILVGWALRTPLRLDGVPAEVAAAMAEPAVGRRKL